MSDLKHTHVPIKPSDCVECVALFDEVTETRSTETGLRAEVRDRIDDMRAQLAVAEDGYLIMCGWRYTSSTPDCVWMWEKEWDGKLLSVSRERALALEGVAE